MSSICNRDRPAKRAWQASTRHASHILGVHACALVVLLSLSGPLWADVFVYECDTWPAEAGWTVINEFCYIEQWIQKGVLHQRTEVCPGLVQAGGQLATYRRSLEDFIGEEQFFIEWRLETDGHPSEIGGVAPAALVASGTTGINYHFTISSDLVRLIRDNFLPIVYVDIEPGVQHIHRLELYSDELYVWYIDGQIVDSGLPEGAYLTDESHTLIWSTKSWFLENEAKWDYIRYGTIPMIGSGDFNSDGGVNDDDVYFFQECLTTEAGSWPGCAWADMDFSGGVDCDDWLLFLAAWTDPADPPAMPECDCNPADLNCDGSVSAFDLALLLGSWGPCPDPPDDCVADLNGDGFVNAFDLAILLGSWG